LTNKNRKQDQIVQIRYATVTERFRLLAEQWHNETGMLSYPAQIVSHPAYLEIIAIRPKMITPILNDLRDVGGYWYPALRALTGENPVPKEARGRPQLMKEAWVQWGREHGYLNN